LQAIALNHTLRRAPALWSASGQFKLGAAYTGSQVFHAGVRPKIKAIEYYPSGQVKRIDFRDFNDMFEITIGSGAAPGATDPSWQNR